MKSLVANGKGLGVHSNAEVDSQEEAAFEEKVIEKIKSDAFIVDWYGLDDPGHPQNLPQWRKWAITMSMALHVLSTTFASSVFSAASRVTAVEFGVSLEVTVLATSLFMAGFATGPILFGPLSERFGRKTPLFTGYLLFTVLQIPVAIATNLPTILVFRFLQGVAGSAPSSIIGGALADIWSPRERGFAVPCVAAFLMIGPVLGPIVGSVIVQSPLGWRCRIEYVTAIMSLTIAAITFPAMTEGYSPILLTRRAKRLRHMTRNWALRAKFEETETNLKDLADRYLQRPAKMLVLEPILLLISIYMSFVFGLTYLFFLAYPMSFALERGWQPTQAGLPLISILLGVVGGGALIAFTTRTRLAPNMQEGRPQETRLLLMILGAVLLPIGMFWFAWTSASTNPWPQIVAGVPIGFGIILINMQGLNYIIDCYMINANSAIAANTCLRSLFAAGFPLFA
ncbi:MAG: Cercosporin MFS transporter ctb4 [Bathelium mastoideum]|nr:MAG: Cercosporin MFS transporter ctb4 [Bathelium mastoideum]